MHWRSHAKPALANRRCKVDRVAARASVIFLLQELYRYLRAAPMVEDNAEDFLVQYIRRDLRSATTMRFSGSIEKHPSARRDVGACCAYSKLGRRRSIRFDSSWLDRAHTVTRQIPAVDDAF